MALTIAWMVGVGSASAAARDYSYLLLQGKVTGRNESRLLTGVTIRLTSEDDQVFETITDVRGVFVFEQLPVTSFRLQVVTPEGRVIKTIRRIDDSRRIRLRVKTHRAAGAGTDFLVYSEQGELAVNIPEPPPRWGKLWTEIAIIVGVALLFAL